MQTTNPTWQRRTNLAVLARAVWQDPGISRRDLDHRFQIDKSSISRLVQVLIDLGLVESVTRSAESPLPRLTSGGRPRVALRIRAEYGQVWGLALWPDKAWLTIANARGEVVLSRERLVPAYAGDWNRYLAEILAFAAAEAEAVDLPLLGIGFGVPGWIDFDDGHIVESGPFGIRDLHPLADLAGTLPLLWENDANCGAWSCQVPGDGLSDALYVLGRYVERGAEGTGCDLGVGFGLVIAGHLYRGWRHRAGEYRSALWNPGWRTSFGVPDAVVGRSRDTSGDFQQVAADLWRNLRSVSEILDPQTIFLGGDFKFRAEGLSQSLASLGWNPSPRLQYLPSGRDEVSLGAAQLVLDELFQLPANHRHSLFRGYGDSSGEPIWRGVPAASVVSLKTAIP